MTLDLHGKGSGNWNTPFRGLFRRMVEETEASNAKYEAALSSGTRHTIPFFGDAEGASVLTVGVNPSGQEFGASRLWGVSKEEPEYFLYLLGRLKNYFALRVPPYEPFFPIWERALSLLGHSYQRDAAHVDVSPRPLLSMQSIRKLKDKGKLDEYDRCRSLFEEALTSDVRWLFELFSVMPDLKCILMAGNLIFSPASLDLWIQRHAPAGWSFDFTPNTARKAKPSRSFGVLTAPKRMGEPSRKYGIFWCSVSPNAGSFGKKPDGLVETVASNVHTFEDLGCVETLGPLTGIRIHSC